jgi:hypothetical protein
MHRIRAVQGGVAVRHNGTSFKLWDVQHGRRSLRITVVVSLHLN